MQLERRRSKFIKVVKSAMKELCVKSTYTINQTKKAVQSMSAWRNLNVMILWCFEFCYWQKFYMPKFYMQLYFLFSDHFFGYFPRKKIAQNSQKTRRQKFRPSPIRMLPPRVLWKGADVPYQAISKLPKSADSMDSSCLDRKRTVHPHIHLPLPPSTFARSF